MEVVCICVHRNLYSHLISSINSDKNISKEELDKILVDKLEKLSIGQETHYLQLK